MAIEPKQIVLIPELDNKDGQFQLVIQTRKYSFNGCIESSVHGQHAKDGRIIYVMGLGAGCGDFSKTYAKSEGRATQSFLDKHHRMAFTPQRIESIIAEVKEFYAKKRASQVA